MTSAEKVIIKGHSEEMPDCYQEEADTIVVFHLKDAVKKGAQTCLVRTVDTDLAMLLIAKFWSLKSVCQTLTLWLAFGIGKHFTLDNFGVIVMALGEDNATAIPIFHAFSGRDTVSAFYGKGIMEHPFTPLDEDSEQFQLLERFTIVVYDKTSSLEAVNECRRALFSQKGKSMDTIPPARSALLQHARRAVYKAGVWATSEESQKDLPSPEGWGWTSVNTGGWQPFWTTQDIASKACSDLVTCGCKSESGCSTGRCTCFKARWKCTELCKCKCNQ